MTAFCTKCPGQSPFFVQTPIDFGSVNPQCRCMTAKRVEDLFLADDLRALAVSIADDIDEAETHEEVEEYLEMFFRCLKFIGADDQ
jgi:hypothetical protein